jgi:hypothetical protein
MFKSKALPIFAGAAALGVLALSGPAARADSITETLGVANPNLATQGSGPYGTVTISGVGTGTTFMEFEVTATGSNNFVFGDSSILGLNLSTAAGTGTLCETNGGNCTTGAPSITLTQAAAGQVDGFGNFNFVVDDGAGFSSPSSTFTFDFTTSNAVTAANLLTLNSDNADKVAHMALATNTACTGFAANTGATKPSGSPDNSACTSVVPAPLIGHGVLVLLAIGGVLVSGKALETFKKRSLHAA